MNFVSLLLIVVVSARLAAASPIGSSYRPIDEPPRLSDTLAVAKSPFEPITLAQVVDPNARNEVPPATTVSLVVVDTVVQQEQHQHNQTTRSTQSLIEQEKDTTPTRDGFDEKQTSDAESPFAGPSTEAISTQAATTAQPEGGAETTTGPTETEAASTKDERQAELTSTTPNPATDITLGTTITTTTEAPSTSTDAAETTTTTTTTSITTEATPAPDESAAVTKAVSEDAATTGSAEESSPEGAKDPASSSTVETVATTLKPASTTLSPETTNDEVKRVVEEQAKPVKKEEPSPIVPVEVVATVVTEAAVAISTTETPTTTTTTTTTTPETTEAPTTTTTTTTTTTAQPVTEPEPKQEDKKEEIKQQQAFRCNHLPTYEADEVQKVFREETTFRNGTIKGKFTYINFDSRYRLVHYTRLPYGPVKIDQVEELGRPEPAANSSATRSPAAPANEIPNAVLQLRNILPNSLFGFPFVAPNSVANKPLDPRDGTSSFGSSFYSTEPLSTPNLLTPNVPVSVLSGRRESDPVSPSAPPQDSLSRNLNDNIALSAPAQAAILEPPKLVHQPIGTTWDNLTPVAPGVSTANNLQFHYALAAQADHLEHTTTKQHNSGPAYTYLTSQPSAHQYQYSPLPLYTFQQPSYFSAHHHSLPIQTAPVAQSPAMTKPALSHQPHDHEHYIAPFMLSQTPQSEQQNEQPTRLKLRVKSAKSLNHNNNGLKSAQLRAQDDQSIQQQHYHHSSYSSPSHAYRQLANNQGRHRAGKQNQELRPTINSTPVVYHVLRSPMGRVYSLPQYRNVHAISYELDE